VKGRDFSRAPPFFLPGRLLLSFFCQLGFHPSFTEVVEGMNPPDPPPPNFFLLWTFFRSLPRPSGMGSRLLSLPPPPPASGFPVRFSPDPFAPLNQSKIPTGLCVFSRMGNAWSFLCYFLPFWAIPLTEAAGEWLRTFCFNFWFGVGVGFRHPFFFRLPAPPF